MSRPVAVLISDIHFNLYTLDLATKALKGAILQAQSLDVPLIIAGDLNDTKAIIRAEVANRLITLLNVDDLNAYFIVGNHDLVNEKAKEHSLNFLSHYGTIVDECFMPFAGIYLLPYFSDQQELVEAISHIPKGSILIIHQGIKGAFMGDYIQDKSSIDPEILKDYKVFSGHYHRHQTIGTITYIGNPYTLSFGEANDGPKGFLILNNDGSYEQIPLKLRRHVIIERKWNDPLKFIKNVTLDDLIWLKVYGPKSELDAIDKKALGESLFGHYNFKLDLVNESDKAFSNQDKISTLNYNDHFDSLIDSLKENQQYKAYLKKLWREVICG